MNRTLHDNFRNNLREIMRQRGLSQHGFAELLGRSQGFVSDVLNGRSSPTLKLVEFFAKKLDADPLDLLSETFLSEVA